MLLSLFTLFKRKPSHLVASLKGHKDSYATQFRKNLNLVASYQASLRDDFIELNGQKVNIYIPDIENVTDEYSDYVDSSMTLHVLWVIPKFDKYYNQLSVLGEDAENELPLDIIAKLKDYIPRNSIIELPSRTDEGLIIDRRWKVISSEAKHIDNQYAKLLHVVPERRIHKDSE